MGRVVVVGAGPAGSATSIHLARLGHDVTLLDRASFPRRKSCGEGVFAPGVRVLEELGVLEQVLPTACVLQSLRMELEGAGAEAPLEPTSLGIRRELLDNSLVERARAEGVDVRLGVTGTGLARAGSRFEAVETGACRVQGDVIVLADGLRSRLRRIAGLDAGGSGRRYGVSAHYRLRQEPVPRVHISLQRGHEVYLTPVGGTLVNVAVLLEGDAARRLGGRLRAGYEELVAACRLLPEAAALADAPLAGGPFPASPRALYRDNLVLAGDAGGFFDGISGEGVSLALQSAGPVARAADAFLRDGDARHFRDYERRRRRLGRNSTLLARINLFLAAHPSLGRRVMGNLGRRPWTFRKLVALNQGELSLSALTPRDVVAALLGA